MDYLRFSGFIFIVIRFISLTPVNGLALLLSGGNKSY